jgi:ABC-2 type transport system permease protein
VSGVYSEIAKKSFLNCLAYRANVFMGILNTCISMIVSLSVWKALYGKTGADFSATATSLILGIGMSGALQTDDFFVSTKIRTGSIAMDLLKPMSFQAYVLAHNLGRMTYRLIVEFAPTLILSSILFGILPPVSLSALGLFLVSIFLGFMVLYGLGYILSLISFWYFNIWSFVTFKNALVAVLAGTFIPYWLMPDWLSRFASVTPFDSIFSIPMGLYLGKIPIAYAGGSLVKQAAWALALWAAGRALWRLGHRRLTIQGG